MSNVSCELTTKFHIYHLSFYQTKYSLYVICGSRKFPYCPHGRPLEVPREMGVLKVKLLEEKYEAKLEFPGGGGGGVGVRGWKTKTFHGGSMEIFWKYTILRGLHTLYVINKSEYVILGVRVVYSQSMSCVST